MADFTRRGQMNQEGTSTGWIHLWPYVAQFEEKELGQASNTPQQQQIENFWDDENGQICAFQDSGH